MVVLRVEFVSTETLNSVSEFGTRKFRSTESSLK